MKKDYKLLKKKGKIKKPKLLQLNKNLKKSNTKSEVCRIKFLNWNQGWKGKVQNHITLQKKRKNQSKSQKCLQPVKNKKQLI